MSTVRSASSSAAATSSSSGCRSSGKGSDRGPAAAQRRFEGPEDRLLPPGPLILRTLPPRWQHPDPENFLRKQGAVPLRQRKTSARSHMHESKFAQAEKGGAGDTQLQSMYDLGLIDFVSVRWLGKANVLIWRQKLSPESLQYYLPVFASGIMCRQEPYQFLAVKGSMDIVRLLGHRTAHACRALTQIFRRTLATQQPDRCAVVCLLLSHILQESPEFGRELRHHFRMIGPGLNRFGRCRDVVDFGIAGERDHRSLGECVGHVLWQLEECCGRGVRPLLHKFVPLYEGPV